MRYDHPRADWQSPKQPVTGPAFSWNGIDLVVLHYTAAPNVPDDTAPYLRSIQNDYVRNRGYSIGYNAAVDQAGESWELRGDTFKCAANVRVNGRAFAILCLVDGDDELSPAAASAVRELIAQALVRAPKAKIVGHGDTDSTSCPGRGIRRQIASGVLDPRKPTSATPAPVPAPPATLPAPSTQEDPDMISATELDDVWDAPGAAGIENSTRWLNACILKVGGIADVQRRHGLRVTGLYDQATAAAYDKDLAAMKTAAGR